MEAKEFVVWNLCVLSLLPWTHGVVEKGPPPPPDAGSQFFPRGRCREGEEGHRVWWDREGNWEEAGVGGGDHRQRAAELE